MRPDKISIFMSCRLELIYYMFSLLSFQEPEDEEDEEDEDKDPNPPMMVPMADMLNHVSNHNANLEYTPVSLRFTR